MPKDIKSILVNWKKFKSAILVLPFFLGSCKTVQEMHTHAEHRKELPASYVSGSLADSVALPTVSEFFQDPNLKALIDSVLANNFELRMNDQFVAEMEGMGRFFRGNNLPNLFALGSIGARRISRFSMDGVGNFDTNFSENITREQRIPDPVLPDYYLGVRSSWEIDIWKKLETQRKQALYKILSSKAGRQLLETEIVAQVASIYFDIQLLENEIEFLDDNIELQETASSIIATMKQAGESNQLAVELTSSQVLSSRALRSQIEQQVIQLENDLHILLGQLPKRIERSKINLTTVPLPNLASSVPSALIKNRPDISQAEYELLAANADVTLARLAFLPDLQLTGDLGFHSFKPQVLFSPQAFVFGLLGNSMMPLLNKRQIEGELLMANARKKAAYLQYERVVNNAFVEVYNCLQILEKAEQQFQLKQKEVAVLRSSIVSATELYKYGKATYLEVVTAQRNALQSQVELIDIRRQQYKTIIELYRALGGGWT